MPSVSALARAGVVYACLLGLSSASAESAERSVDITYSVPDSLAGGDRSFAVGLEAGNGLIIPLGAYTEILTGLTDGDFTLGYNVLSLTDTPGLGLTYPDAAFYTGVVDVTAPLTQPGMVLAGVFKRNDAFNDDTHYVLATGCDAAESAGICALAEYIYPGSSAGRFGYQDIPEPASLALLAVGLIGLGLAIRQRVHWARK